MPRKTIQKNLAYDTERQLYYAVFRQDGRRYTRTYRTREEAQAALEGREIPPLPPLAQRCDIAVRQFELSAAQKGEHIACLEARKHYAWYLKGVPYAGYYKEQISHLSTMEDIYQVTAGIKRDLK